MIPMVQGRYGTIALANVHVAVVYFISENYGFLHYPFRATMGVFPEQCMLAPCWYDRRCEDTGQKPVKPVFSFWPTGQRTVVYRVPVFLQVQTRNLHFGETGVLFSREGRVRRGVGTFG